MPPGNVKLPCVVTVVSWHFLTATFCVKLYTSAFLSGLLWIITAVDECIVVLLQSKKYEYVVDEEIEFVQSLVIPGTRKDGDVRTRTVLIPYTCSTVLVQRQDVKVRFFLSHEMFASTLCNYNIRYFRLRNRMRKRN